jgi:Hpt domain
MENANKSLLIIDETHLDEMTFGDVALKSEIIGMFREQTQMWQRLLDVTSPTPDWMVGAHTIKGSARSIGAWVLGEICDGAEEAAKLGSLSKDEKYIWREQIIQAMDDVLIELANIEHKIALNSLKS